MSTRPLLHLGSTHPDVQLIVERLRAEGFWSEPEPLKEFTPELEDSVRYFQRTHLGPDGTFLAADGVVGEKTWWALLHASGTAQRSGLTPTIPARLGPRRTRILQVALAQHTLGVEEVPNGSNRGPLVDAYLPSSARSQPGPPWCCYFYSWVVHEALDQWPLGARFASCHLARRRAGSLGLYIPKGMHSDRPLPGDAFVMDRGGGHGHIGFVLRLSEDRRLINTVEGNCGNRVKVGTRWLEDPEIIGFIDNVPGENAPGFELGVVSSAAIGPDSTR